MSTTTEKPARKRATREEMAQRRAQQAQALAISMRQPEQRRAGAKTWRQRAGHRKNHEP